MNQKQKLRIIQLGIQLEKQRDELKNLYKKIDQTEEKILSAFRHQVGEVGTQTGRKVKVTDNFAESNKIFRVKQFSRFEIVISSD